MRRWLVVGWMMAGIILFAGKTATEEILPADSAAEIPAPRYVALTFVMVRGREHRAVIGRTAGSRGPCDVLPHW